MNLKNYTVSKTKDGWKIHDPVKGEMYFYINEEKQLVVRGFSNPGYTPYEVLEQLIPKYIPETYRGALIYLFSLPVDGCAHGVTV